MSAPTVAFKAGRLFRRGDTNWVDPQPEKGVVLVTATEDGLIQWQWKNRTTNALDEDLLIFPSDTTFSQVAQSAWGRTYVLAFSSSDQKHFYWLQDASSARDDQIVDNVNGVFQDASFEPTWSTPAASSSSAAAAGSSSISTQVDYLAPALDNDAAVAAPGDLQVPTLLVRLPSQMLENWCWVPSVLAKMSSHYKTKEPLSSELIDRIIKSRYVNIGMFMLRQLFFGKYDITVHTSKESEDYTKLWARLREETSLVKGPAVDMPGQGSFAHLTGDYDAGYYGYAYSLVFAADMYRAVFAKDPLLSPEAGRLYREQILGPGGSRDEMDSLKAFLGRPPNSEAFLEQLLGTSKTAES